MIAKTIDEHLTTRWNDIQPQLHRKWWLAVGVYLVIYLGGFLLLNFVRPHHHASQWFLQTAVVATYVLYLLRIALPLNYHPQQKVVYSTIGLATWITVLRGMLIAMLAGYLFQPWSQTDIGPIQRSWAPGAMYIMAAILDYVDGVVARVRNHATRLGEFLDVNIDGLGLLVAPLLAVWYSQLPLAYLSVSAAYYLLNMGIWLRKKVSLPVFKLEPRAGARMVAGFQMGFVGIALLPVFSPPATTIAAYIFMIPLLAGFVKDWLFVCGYTTANSLRAKGWEHGLTSLFSGYVPFFLRIILCIIGFINLIKARLEFVAGIEADSGYLLHFAREMPAIWRWMFFIAACLLMLGILARVAAFGISLSCAWIMNNPAASLETVFVYFCALVILLTGSGIFSAWQPEDKYLIKKFG